MLLSIVLLDVTARDCYENRLFPLIQTTYGSRKSGLARSDLSNLGSAVNGFGGPTSLGGRLWNR